MSDDQRPEISDLTFSTDDIDTLNSATVVRAAAFARVAGAVIVAAGLLGVAAWLWAVVRGQQHIDDIYTGFGEPSEEGASLVDRVDVFVREIAYLMFGVITVGLGIAMRVLADYAVAQTGGSLTGFVEGDAIPADDEGSPDGV